MHLDGRPSNERRRLTDTLWRWGSTPVNKSNKKRRTGRVRKNKAPRAVQSAGSALPPAVRNYLAPRPREVVQNQSELKSVEESRAMVEIVNTGTLEAIGDPAQGIGVTQRIGDEIEILAVELRYAAVMSSLSTIAGFYRIIIFQWNQDNASTAPTLATVLTNSGTAADYPFSPYNTDNVRSGYLGILYDRTHFVSQTMAVTKHITIPVRKHLRFNAAAQTGTGVIYVLTVSNFAAANDMDGAWFSRVVFKDTR